MVGRFDGSDSRHVSATQNTWLTSSTGHESKLQSIACSSLFSSTTAFTCFSMHIIVVKSCLWTKSKAKRSREHDNTQN